MLYKIYICIYIIYIHIERERERDSVHISIYNIHSNQNIEILNIKQGSHFTTYQLIQKFLSFFPSTSIVLLNTKSERKLFAYYTKV